MQAVRQGGRRTVVQQAVFGQVYQSYRSSTAITSLQRFAPNPALTGMFTNNATQVRQFSRTLVTSWFPSWTPGWRQAARAQAAPVQQQPASGQAVVAGGQLGDDGQASSSGGRQQRDARRLTPGHLVMLMADSSNYLVHGTPNQQVGTLQAPLVGIDDPDARVTNKQAYVGVYAFRGITGAYEAGYGPYYVIIRWGMGTWYQQHGHWFRPGQSPIGDDEIVGYCLREDISQALALKSGGAAAAGLVEN